MTPSTQRRSLANLFGIGSSSSSILAPNGKFTRQLFERRGLEYHRPLPGRHYRARQLVRQESAQYARLFPRQQGYSVVGHRAFHCGGGNQRAHHYRRAGHVLRHPRRPVVSAIDHRLRIARVILAVVMVPVLFQGRDLFALPAFLQCLRQRRAPDCWRVLSVERDSGWRASGFMSPPSRYS